MVSRVERVAPATTTARMTKHSHVNLQIHSTSLLIGLQNPTNRSSNHITDPHNNLFISRSPIRQTFSSILRTEENHYYGQIQAKIDPKLPITTGEVLGWTFSISSEGSKPRG
jgi:hypothetical protein